MAHILLAEDDESLRKFLAQALVRAGHAVTDFGDGGEAWECLKGFRFDLLLTDIVMPGLNGRDLARRFSSLRAESKILLTSGYSDGMAGVSQLDPTVNYLPKPFSAEKLTQVVKQVLAGDRSEPRP